MKKTLCVVIASLFMWACSSNETATPHQISISSIPMGTMAVCSVPNPSMASLALGSSMYVKALDSMSVSKDLDRGLHLYDILSGGKTSDRELIIALAPVKARELSCLFISRLDPAETISAVTAGDTTISTRSYEGRDIHTLSVPSGQLHYYHHMGMTIASMDALYIEQSLLQTTSGINMAKDKEFVKAYDRIASSDEVAVAFSPSSVADFMSKQMGFDDVKLATGLSPWVSVDVEMDSVSVKLNGVFCASDSIRTYAKVLASQKPHPLTLDSYFPSSTYAYTYLGINDWEAYMQQYALYLKSSAQYHQYNVSLQRYDSLFKCPSVEFFTPWAGEGVAIVRSADGKYSTDEDIVVSRIIDIEAAYDALDKIKDPAEASPDPYRSHRIVKINPRYSTIFAELISPALGKKGVKYAACLQDVMIAAASLTQLKMAIEDIENNTTLTRSSLYVSSKDNMATPTAMMTMVRADLMVKEMGALVKEKRKTFPIRLSEVESYIWKHGTMLTPLRYNFVQVSPTGGIPFFNFYGLWSTDAPREAVKAWTYMMGAAPAVKTIPFPNHKTGRIDVLCMDTDGYVYLLSHTGTLYWKKKLPAASKGDIRIVDLYKNRKWQMAFTAGDKFYVIDRNGNPVTAADKVSSAKKAATIAPTARVTSTNTIEISKAGKTINVKTPHSPVSEALYLRSKDIIVYALSTGQIYAMKSTGEEIPGFPIAGTQFFTAEDFAKNGTLDIVTTSSQGAVTMHRIPLK